MESLGLSYKLVDLKFASKAPDQGWTNWPNGNLSKNAKVARGKLRSVSKIESQESYNSLDDRFRKSRVTNHPGLEATYVNQTEDNGEKPRRSKH